MSQIHKCADGSIDVTGRNTPNKIPCENKGGVVRSGNNKAMDEDGEVLINDIDTRPTVSQFEPTFGKIAAPIGQYGGIGAVIIAIVGVLGYYAYTKGMFK